MFTRLWWNTFSTSNYRLRPLDLSARLPRDFLLLSWGEKQVRNSMIWLRLGQARYAFCLNLCKWWVSFGFNLNGKWLWKLWLQIQFLSTIKEKNDILIEIWRNRPQSKNYIEIVYSFIVSIQFIYHLMSFVTLFSLSLSQK